MRVDLCRLEADAQNTGKNILDRLVDVQKSLGLPTIAPSRPVPGQPHLQSQKTNFRLSSLKKRPQIIFLSTVRLC